jgi:agmatine deiminase
MPSLQSQTPRTLGFYLPAESAPHAATWLAWPDDDELWMGYLDRVREEVTAFVNTIARFEPVHLLVANDAVYADAQRRVGKNVFFHIVPYSDIWVRDSGPIFLVNNQDEVLLTDWEFNGWGNKFSSQPDNSIPRSMAQILDCTVASAGIVLEGGSIEPDGQGTILSTRQCLLSKERNPHLSQTQIEEKLREYLGINQVIWLNDGLQNDHTDGHIDTLARFIDCDRVLTVACEDSVHCNYNATQENIDILRSSRGSNGNAILVTELPLPKNAIEFDGYDLPASYANYYICNGAVIVPQYGDPNDSAALGILRPLYPDREIIGLSARALVTGGGAFHCITQQQPQGSLWSVK